jgi:hypothetical protein
MRELLAGFDGSIFDGSIFYWSIKDEKASNVCPAGIDIAYHRLGKGDSHTYGHTRDTSIF